MDTTKTLSISHKFPETRLRPTRRTAEIGLHFGLGATEKPATILENLKIKLAPGKITLLLGPSGSGKSTAINNIAQQLPGGHAVDRCHCPDHLAIADAVAPHQPLDVALNILAAAGLAESPLWLKSSSQLSDGQRFRAQLARAIARHITSNTSAPLICDEFCSNLHRRLARAISHNIRKLATRHKITFILAAANDDILRDLQPDTIVRFTASGQYTVETHTPKSKPVSFLQRLTITPGRKRDYNQFASLHYRTTDELGFTSKIFLLRDKSADDILGILVYAHPPLSLALRNLATNKRFVRDLKALNKHVRILRRLVIHPDIRGCGIGHRFVRKTLPMVGTTYVECLAAMGAINPVFEKAGMTKIGTCNRPATQVRALAELKALGVDPFARDFSIQVARRPRVRKLVRKAVGQWYQATSGAGKERADKQSPQFLAQTFRGLVGTQPVYYLWKNPAPESAPESKFKPKPKSKTNTKSKSKPKSKPESKAAAR